MFTQKRFVSIGGRAIRPGGGKTHSRTSVKQVSSIPTAPGSPGRSREGAPSPLYIPLSRLSQPQLRLRSPDGRWKGIDTSFSDLQGVSDLVITAADVADVSRVSEVVEELQRLCKDFQFDKPIAQFRYAPMALNSGPEQDSIQNHTKTRRQWFAIVRSFYRGRDAMLGGIEGVGVDDLYDLVSRLDAANMHRVRSPKTWEDEPPECYMPLPIEPFVARLAAVMRSQPGGLGSCPANKLVGVASMAARYENVGVPATFTAQCFAAAAHRDDLTMDLCVALASTICGIGTASDVHEMVGLASRALEAPSGYELGAHEAAITAFFTRMTSNGTQQMVDTYKPHDLRVLLLLAAGARRSNPNLFGKGSSLSHFVGVALGAVQRLLTKGRYTIRREGGYNPVEDFATNTRVSHKDIHPHLRLRMRYSEGQRSVTLIRGSASHLLEAYNAYLRCQGASMRLSGVANRLLEQRVTGETVDSTTVVPEDYLSTLEAAIECYGGHSQKVGELLRGFDSSLRSSVAITSAETCVKLLEACGVCRFLPRNISQLESQLLALIASPAHVARSAVAFAQTGHRSASTFNALLTRILPMLESTGDAGAVAVVGLLHASCQVLSGSDVSSLVSRVEACRPLPPANGLEPAVAIQCAQVLACAASVALPEDEALLQGRVIAYLVSSVERELTILRLVEMTTTCMTMGVGLDGAVAMAMASSSMRGVADDADAAAVLALPSAHLAAMATGLPLGENLDTAREYLYEEVSRRLAPLLALDSSTADALEGCLILLTAAEVPRSVVTLALRQSVGALIALDGSDDVSHLGGVFEVCRALESAIRDGGHWEEAEQLFEAALGGMSA